MNKWNVEISRKSKFVSVVNYGSGFPRVNFGSVSLNELGQAKNAKQQERLNFAFMVRDALNEHAENHKESINE